MATAGLGVVRRLQGVGRGNSLDVLYSAATVTPGRSLSKRFGSIRMAAPLHACPPLPLVLCVSTVFTRSACVLLITNPVFIVYVHSAPQNAKSGSNLSCVERL